MKCRDFGIRSLEGIFLTAENSNTPRISGNTLNWMFWNTLQHQQQFLVRLAPKYLNSLRSSAQSSLPKNVFNFSIKCINNALPTKTNLKRWGLSPSSDCSFCLAQESLLHIVSDCKVYLQQGRYTWHHDSILMLNATIFRSLQHAKIFADIPGFPSTSVITGNDLRPDLLLSLFNKSLYTSELTVEYESNLENNAKRKEQKHKELVSS